LCTGQHTGGIELQKRNSALIELLLRTGTLTALLELKLGGNRLSGRLPGSWGRGLGHLKSLDLSGALMIRGLMPINICLLLIAA